MQNESTEAMRSFGEEQGAVATLPSQEEELREKHATLQRQIAEAETNLEMLRRGLRLLLIAEPTD